MAKSDLWQRLNREVSLANMKALITGDPDDQPHDAIDAQAEEILAHAAHEAKQRGKPLEAVLAERGFSLPTAAAPRAEPPAPWPSVAETLAPHLRPLAVADIAALLQRPVTSAAEAEVVDRLSALYPEHAERARTAPAAGAPSLWARLLAQGVPAEALADALRADPRCPPTEPPGAVALPRVTGLPRKPSKAATADFPLLWVRLFRAVPLRRSGAALVVAVPYPPPERLLQQLAAALGRRVQAQLAVAEELEPLRVQLVGPAPPVVAAPAAPAPAAPTVAPTPPAAPAAAAPPAAASLRPSGPHLVLPELRYTSAVELVQQFLRLALDARATDIHIEPADRGARIRFRIDGICHEALRLSMDDYLEVAARLKILADLDVTERRRPQDGHIRTAIGGIEHDLRLATVPARGGEKIGVRIANTGRISMQLHQLGLSAAELAVLRDIATLPFGMILATGPVGSGKTTTLYSCLAEVDRTQRHVMTIEDPIEFTLEGANHVEVHYGLGFDFVQGLRALLRQDPDVILIGEIRDEETARIAIRGSMTGLMVYSTLHANVSTGAVTALRNFHIAPHLLTSAIRGVIAQRLLRKICSECRVPQPLRPEDARFLGMEELPEGLRAFRGAGCPACLHTGYSGRTGVFEIFRIDETVRDMILEEKSEREIRAYAIGKGMRTLQQDGLQKIADGVTTIEEFHRVLRF